MVIVLVSVTILAFVLYFYLIGLWYLSFLPLMLFFVLIGHFTSTMNWRNQIFDTLAKYSLFIAWLVILGGLALMLHFFNLSMINISISLIVLNLVLWIGSYLFDYKDGKLVFQTGYYLSIVFLLVNVFLQTNLAPFTGLASLGFFDVFSIIWVAQLGIIGFIVYIVGLRTKIDEYMTYKLLFFCIGAVIIIVINQIHNLYLALFIGNILLFGVYTFIYKILQKKPPIQEKVIDISVKRILAGDRIMQKASDQRQNNFSDAIYNFLYKMPVFIKYLLEIFSTLIIITLIVNYILNLGVVQDVASQILYWLVIIFYILNVYVLRKIGYTSFVQRLLIFLVINFAIYISMFSIFKSNISQSIMWLVIWNVVSNLLVFYTHKTPLYKILQKSDYVYWLVTVFIALIVNVILLIGKSGLPGQLLFSMIFLYLGIQGMILFYSVRYIKNKFFQDEMLV